MTSQTSIKIENLKKDEKSLRNIVETLLTFGDVDDDLDGVDSSIGNISCPFHPYEGLQENKKSPAAKMYFHEQNQYYFIKCFTTNRQYTVYDYIKYVKQLEVYDCLVERCDKEVVLNLYENILKGNILFNINLTELKNAYIDSVYSETNNTVDYIERLYCPEYFQEGENK